VNRRPVPLGGPHERVAGTDLRRDCDATTATDATSATTTTRAAGATTTTRAARATAVVSGAISTCYAGRAPPRACGSSLPTRGRRVVMRPESLRDLLRCRTGGSEAQDFALGFSELLASVQPFAAGAACHHHVPSCTRSIAALFGFFTLSSPSTRWSGTGNRATSKRCPPAPAACIPA
jgi:hypothetical protein